MKKFTLIFALAAVSLTAFSQKTYRAMGWKLTKDVPLNEVKINLPMTILGSYPEISYERILTSDVSVGASLGVALEKERLDMNFSFIPYARWFFGGNRDSMSKSATGFFIEMNGALISSDVKKYYEQGEPSIKTENQFGAGLGFGIGWKYLSKGNWVGEILVGGGRDFVNDSAYPHWGISLGKRF